jgi:carboxyl-terminal processing protease
MFPNPNPESPDQLEATAPPPETELETEQSRKRPAAGNEAAGAAAAETSEIDERVEEARQDGTTRSRKRGLAPSRLSLILVAVLGGSALFMGGYSLGAHVATTPGTPADQETRFGPFWDVYSLIQSDFAGSTKPTPDQLVQAAIKGMMESLNDQWSYYQGPSDFQSSLLNVGGQALGIGVQVELQPIDPNSGLSCTKIGNGCEMAIVKPIPGSPAAAAGVLAGDVIVSVAGTSLDGMTIDQAIALIKGPVNTPVTLGLLRGTTSIQKTIVRQIYSQPEIDTKTLANGAVAYIQVSGINQPASSQFDTALAEALAAGQHNVILDLRGNPGGYVADAVKIASEFIPSGTICYQQDASGKTSELTATAGGRATDPSVHLVVLVDGNTASAAEILAGALQARGRAKLVGAKTYGKGVVQEWLQLSNDFGGIHLTVARWLTPDKVWINGKGLLPDVAVSSANARAGTDPVLDAGLQQLGFPPEPAASASPNASASAASAQSASPSAAPSPAASPS